MKRNINLVPLSREHHLGLLCSWKIREGIKKQVSYNRIKKYIDYFWENNLSAHFEIEDKVLPKIESNCLQKKMEKEHVELRKLINHIHHYQDINLLSEFAKVLNDHIRFEERVVFPYYEKELKEILSKKITKIRVFTDKKNDYEIKSEKALKLKEAIQEFLNAK